MTRQEILNKLKSMKIQQCGLEEGFKNFETWYLGCIGTTSINDDPVFKSMVWGDGKKNIEINIAIQNKQTGEDEFETIYLLQQ